jgi:hypothetical protein
MKLVEGTHYTRRLDQPSPHQASSKEMIDYLFCRLPSYSEDEVERGQFWHRKQVKNGIRLDILMKRVKAKHKGEISSEGISLLYIGFTQESGREAAQM